MKIMPPRFLLLGLLVAGDARALLGPAFQAQLGQPTAATPDATNHSDYLLSRPQYVLGYNDAAREPNWVAWDLTTGDRGSVDRSDAFAADPLLPPGFTALDQDAYRNSGYDRGHMCPSADRTLTLADNQATFYMTNIVPQAPDNNQGPWARFEDECRRLADLGNELLLVSGPAGFTGSALPSGAAIPGYTWKVVVVVPEGPGPAVGRITEATRVIALKVPNIAGIRSAPWQNFITSAAEIEAITGYTFFRAVAPSVAAVLRAKVDGQAAGEAPVITRQPGALTALAGTTATLSVAASGVPAPTFQWRKDGVPIPGATDATLTLPGLSSAGASVYTVVIANAAGSVTSNVATVRVITRRYAGIYFGVLSMVLPAGDALVAGSAALLIRSDNTGVLLAHENQNARAYVNRAVVVDDDGRFRFPVSALSDDFLIEGSIADDGSVIAHPRPASAFAAVPAWTLQATKTSETGAAAGVAGYYEALAPENAATLHAIVAASGRVFLIIRNSASAEDGTGQLDGSGGFVISTGGQTITGMITAPALNLTATVKTAAGAVTTYRGFASQAAALRDQRVVNLSTRTAVGSGDQAAIVGFVVSGLESKSVLIRGIGPALRDFGVASAVPAPRLELFRGASAIAANSGWSSAPNSAGIASAASRVGAFPLVTGSGDSAIVALLAPGNYTAVVSAADGRAGVGLVEVYDLSDASPLQRLVNLSARAAVGTGEGILISGLSIAGSVPKRLLLRAAGPALAQFGVAGALMRPQLTLFSGSRILVQNSGWMSSADRNDIVDASIRAGAFPFRDDSADAAIVINLAPGSYTAQVTGINGATGVALVEVYEVP